MRQFERQLGILAGLAERWPDPRSQRFVTHSAERLLTQLVYQILAGFPDSNDANQLRQDAVFKTLVDIAPEESEVCPAGGSTMARFHYAYTRRQQELPPAERPAFFEQRQARLKRIALINEYLRELFIRTRPKPPPYVIRHYSPDHRVSSQDAKIEPLTTTEMVFGGASTGSRAHRPLSPRP